MMEVGSQFVRNCARRSLLSVSTELSCVSRGWFDNKLKQNGCINFWDHRSAEEHRYISGWSRKVQMWGSSLFIRDFWTESAPKKKKKRVPLQERKMIDKFRVHARGGEGGAGCTSFRKSRQSRHGISDGGNGGKGGDVILTSSAAVWDFSNLQHHLACHLHFAVADFSSKTSLSNGERGGPGSSKRKVGSRGIDKIVQVPVGTVIHLVKGTMPFLEQASTLQDGPTWEEWEGGVTHKSCETLAHMVQHDKIKTFDEEKIQHRVDFSAQDQGNELHLQKSSTDSLLGCEPTLQDNYASQQSFPEDGRSRSCAELPHSISDESSDQYDSEESDQDWEGDDDEREQEIQSSVAEFISVGQSFIVACGGEGGKGNAAMARGRGSDKSLPSFEHEQGKTGSETDLILELKTIADVGLVGAPNAGKSTLLGALSKATPTTGHYKFTTLRPNIGVLEYDDFFSLTVADIPGLIEGAHENRGLGHAFLRHIERTKLLAYVVDLAGGIGDNKDLLPWDQFEELVFELEQYQKGLSQRPSIVVANKIDEDGALTNLEEFRKKFPFLDIYPVCAVLAEGVDELKVGLRQLVESSEPKSCTLSTPREQ